MDIGQLLSIGLALWRSGAHETYLLAPTVVVPEDTDLALTCSYAADLGS